MSDVIKKFEKMLGMDYKSITGVIDKFKEYKARAQARGLSFDMPYQAFEYLVKQPCFFCKHKKGLEIAGVDRLDNSQGYVSGNCVSCCWDCNRLKSNKPLKEHIEFLKRFNPNLEISETPTTLHWHR